MSVEVYDQNGRRLRLAGPGRSGGEGTVYPVEGLPVWAAKIYHPHRVTAELEDKIAAMMRTPPRDPAWESRRHRSIAWVQQALYHDAARRSFAGFTMPALDLGVFREAHAWFDPADRARLGGAFTWRHLLAAAANLASAVAAVHAAGHRVGDLRETNLLVSPAGLVSIIDCDSFQVRDASGRVFYPRVGTAEYLPPELQGADFARDHDRTAADAFGLAVLAFKLLMGGAHPFACRGSLADPHPTTAAKIERGLFAYEGRWRGLEPPPYAPPYSTVPPALRTLFRRAFADGHRKPKRRPGPDEWQAALKEEAARVQDCASSRTHAFGGHLRACPWCAAGDDPFAPAPAVRAAAPAPRRVVAPHRSGGVATRPRAAAVAPAAIAHPAGAAAAPPGLLRLGWRLVRRISATPKRAGVALLAVAIVAAGLSPLGSATTLANQATLEWSEAATGPCPFDGTERLEPPPGCSVEWRLGPVTVTEHTQRRLFVLTRTSARATVNFRVAADASGSCSVPWASHIEMTRRAPAVCFGTCPGRFELRGAADRPPGRLLSATGAGARLEPLRCGESYEGSWTFDVAGTAGPLRLHVPGLGERALPAAIAPA